jgi:hypothetical protein
VAADNSFPKWVGPHPNHIVRSGPYNIHISTPEFPEFYIDRENNVTVYVRDAAEEKKALADPHPRDLFSIAVANISKPFIGHNSKAADDDDHSA